MTDHSTLYEGDLIDHREGFEVVPVRDLRGGDLIDLYGDPYADPECDPDNCYEFLLAPVADIEFETRDWARVDVEGPQGAFGCPPDHHVSRLLNMDTMVGDDA